MGKSDLHTDVDVSVGPVQKKEKSSKKRKSTDITDTSSTSSKTKSKSKDKSSKKRKVAAEALDSTSEVDQVKEDDKEDEPTKVDSVNANVQNVAEDVDAQPSKKRKLSIEEIEVDITAPEPPSKKALRALKKGKPLPPSKSGAEPTAEAGEKKAEVEKRSEHGIWIGNLPFHVSKDDLRKFFVEYSDIMEDAITRVHMPSPDDKKSANQVQEQKVGRKVHNKGFAYVDFKSAKDVAAVIELSEQLLGGRRVLIKDSKSFEGRPQKTKEESRAEGKPPNKRVFLGNLRFDVTEESIKEHFEKCGPVESVKVATFEDSGKCKGYAWVVFEDLEAAGYAVRGYVMKEEEDSAAESESESESDEEGHKSKPKKLRKWWVNKIMGRPLRVEYAEDAQIRYKKRYGKGGSKIDGASEANGDDASARVHSYEKAPKAPVKYDLPYGGAHLTGGIVEATGKKITF
ncbi:hypothetical protein B0O99DRAFT_628910 [Bisporella sp. PMI_857]|nr:hypothetical protein B0O99DRAFT_628910 [Bisporella sp. PMI_857]